MSSEPKRIYVRARLLSFSSFEDECGKPKPLQLIDSESCGFMLAYSSRGKFGRAHPGEAAIVFEVTGPSSLEGRVGACPVCSKAFKLNSAGRMPSHGPPGNRCGGARKEPKIDGPRVRAESKSPEESLYDSAMKAEAVRTMSGPPAPPMSGGPIVGKPI